MTDAAPTKKSPKKSKPLPPPTFRDTVLSRLLGRWEAFYSWLAENEGFGAEFCPGDPQYCPAHVGESGEAFRFFDDAEVTGAGICNSCEHLRAADGYALVLGWLIDGKGLNEKAAEAQAQRIFEKFFSLEQVPETPCPASAVRVSEWVRSNDHGVVVRYLQSRGISISADEMPLALRGFTLPGRSDRPVTHQVRALICAPSGEPVSYQIVRLDEHYRKAARGTVKYTAGLDKQMKLDGAYIDLGADQSRVMLLSEGFETALAGLVIYRAARPDAPDPILRAFAPGGSRIDKQSVPEGVKEIVLLADNDHTLEAQRKNAHALSELTGLPVKVAPAPEFPDTPKPDWLNALDRVGAVESGNYLLQIIGPNETAPEMAPIGISAKTAAQSAKKQALRQISLAETDDPELMKVLTDIVHDELPSWYWHEVEGCAVYIGEGVSRPVDTADVVSWFAARVGCYNSRGEAVGTPSGRVRSWWMSPEVQQYMRENLPPLVGVLRRPCVLRANSFGEEKWRFIRKAGYDASTRTYLWLDDSDRAALEASDQMLDHYGVDLANPAPAPFRKLSRLLHVVLSQIIDEMFYDFHFDEDADAAGASRANAVAMMLTPIFAPAAGYVPLFLVDAPQRGSGKTTLVNASTTLWGSPYQFGYPRDDEELEKRLGAAFDNGESMVVIDNVSRRLHSDTLARLITDPGNSKIRRLGSNTIIAAPLGLTFYATGNNTEVQEEMMRRSILIRLEPKGLDPAMRTGFRHTDLIAYVRDGRPSLRAALYTALSLWHSVYRKSPFDAAPMQRPDRPVFTNFEAWASMLDSFMRMFLAPEHYSGFLANRSSWLRQGDSETESIQAFIDEWWVKHKSRMQSAKDLAGTVLPVVPVLPDSGGSPQKLLGYFLKSLKGRRFVPAQFVEDHQRGYVEVTIHPKAMSNSNGYSLRLIETAP